MALSVSKNLKKGCKNEEILILRNRSILFSKTLPKIYRPTDSILRNLY